MSRYKVDPMEFSGLRTVSLDVRGGKIRVEDFASPSPNDAGVRDLIDSLPRILAAESLRGVIAALEAARARRKPILWALGGHVIKTGLAPVLTGLMQRGYATAFVLNGAAAIHDFEIALAGCTSEDVGATLPDGGFGSAEETGSEMNRAISAASGIGMGEALGCALQRLANPMFAPKSLLHEAYRASVPVTVHVAIGTDTPHTHPACDGASVGRATHHDFRLLCSLMRELNDGGVFLNVGSAVMLPEVFLKAVSAVRNLGHPLKDFTTVNFDFLQHYRPQANVVERPHAQSGGRGFSITGHHEIMIPLLAAALRESAG